VRTFDRYRRAATVLVAAIAATGATARPPDDLAAAVRDYGSWTKVTRTPYAVAPALSVLCAAPSAAPADPHAGTTIEVFVNDAGRDAMLRPGAGAFPAGSIVVKEKHTAESGRTPALLTVMIKREPGYNAEVGDWEFAVLDGAGAVEARGKLATCAACHVRVAGSDYVFRPYLEPAN
jgi:hypothetical protein